MSDSFPINDDFSGPPRQRECREPYERLETIQERMLKILHIIGVPLPIKQNLK